MPDEPAERTTRSTALPPAVASLTVTEASANETTLGPRIGIVSASIHAAFWPRLLENWRLMDQRSVCAPAVIGNVTTVHPESPDQAPISTPSMKKRNGCAE